MLLMFQKIGTLFFEYLYNKKIFKFVKKIFYGSTEYGYILDN